MKRISLTEIKILFSCCGLLLLTACGDIGEDDAGSTSKALNSGDTVDLTSLSGAVADGYLRDAQVWLDRNGNRLCDPDEPQTRSVSGGTYTLEVAAGEGAEYPVLARAIAGETIDEDSGQTVADEYLLESPPGRWAFISPLTTLVQRELHKNPGFTEQQAEVAVRTRLGIVDAVSLFTDYLDETAQDTEQREEYARTHRAAQVVAGLMGRVRSAITANLGGQLDGAESTLLAYMISDQVAEQSAMVCQAMNDERNSVEELDPQQLVHDCAAQINTDLLDVELLALYQERIEQNLATWHIQPPRVISQFPPADDNASIDTLVEVVFDENLDEMSIHDATLRIHGPQGDIAAQLSFQPDQNSLQLVPEQPLLPFSEYQVIIAADLSDALGNPLGEDMGWSFNTIFDQVPPALPEF